VTRRIFVYENIKHRGEYIAAAGKVLAFEVAKNLSRKALASLS